jgi:hypothetical protein
MAVKVVSSLEDLFEKIKIDKSSIRTLEIDFQ